MTHEAVQFFGQVYHHKFIVMKYLNVVIRDLITRAESHDDSKFSEEEFPLYVEVTKELALHPYGSPENEAIRIRYQKLFAHHWEKNRHHPEHHANGVEDMTLTDLLEMLADWKASSMRDNKDILSSIQHCGEKYNIHPQLIKILVNTAKSCKM